MNIFDNLLGSFGYTRYSDGSHYNSIKSLANFGNKSNTQLALCNPVLSAVLNIRANCLSKAKFYILEKDGTKNFDDASLELIKTPNAFQSQEDFIKEYELLRCIHGWVYQKPFGAVGFIPDAIFNLNPSNIEFPSSMGASMLWEKKEVADYLNQTFKYHDEDKVKSIAFADIIPFYDIANGLLNTETSRLTSPSRIDAIIKQVVNIGLLASAENVHINSFGKELIMEDQKSTSSDDFSTPATPKLKEDKQDIKNKLNNKHLQNAGISRTLIPDTPLAWVDMSLDAKRLAASEGMSLNASLVTQAFQVPNEIYQAYKTGSTFENQAQAEVKFYQNAMQPVADDLASSWTTSFGDVERPFKASFEHLPMMQDVEDKKADKVTKISKALKDLKAAGFSVEQSIVMMQSLGVNIEITK